MKLLKKIKNFLRKLLRFGKSDGKSEQQQTQPTQQPQQPQQPAQQPQPVVSENEFKYSSFGSPNCSKAVEDPKVQIKDFKWSKSQLSYKWASKTKLEQWGVSDPHDHTGALACFGYQDKSGKWLFCKIDWISSDRLTRDMHNVVGRHNGIDPDAYFSAKHHGFFIMEANGKRRSNVLTD